MGKEKKSDSQNPSPEDKKLKLPDIILISLTVVFVVIGIYEIMELGPSSGYWSVMLALVCFFAYHIRKNKK